MSHWTYSGNPGNSGLDQVRFLVGDTRAKQPLLLDGEIAWLLEIYGGNPLLAAVRACEALIANAATLVDQSVGSVSLSLSQRLSNLADTVLPMLRARMTLECVVVYAGGLSRSGKQANNANGDLVPPQFTRRLFDPRHLAIGPLRTNSDGTLMGLDP